jgi:hypothetical protein
MYMYPLAYAGYHMSSKTAICVVSQLYDCEGWFMLCLDISHRPAFHSKQNVSETESCLRFWRVEVALLIRLNCIGYTWKRRHNPVSETLQFK